MDNKTLAAIAGALALTVLGWFASAVVRVNDRVDATDARDREVNARVAKLEKVVTQLDRDVDRIITYVIRQHQRNEQLLDGDSVDGERAHR